MLAHIVALVLITLVARVVPRMLRPYAISSDAFYHLLAADRIRENGYRLPERLRGLCFPGPYDYPPLFHVLLALFPQRWVRFVEQSVSAALDALYVTGAYVSFLWLLRVDGVPSPELPAFAVALLMSLSPALLYSGRGPRAYNANPRIFSELLFGAMMVLTARWYLVGDAWGFAGAVVSGAALLLASKFGAQVVLVVFPLLALGLAAPSILLIPALAFVAAMVPWRGHYWAVLKGHVGHLLLFGSLGSRPGAPMARRSEWTEFVRVLLSPHKPGSWYRLLCLNSVSSLLIRNPQLPLVLWIAETRWSGPAELFLVVWIYATLIAFFIISLRPLLFLGEPERYVSYSVIAQFGLLALGFRYVPQTALVVLVCLMLGASALYQLVFVRLNYKNEASRRNGAQLKEFFQQLTPIRRILPIAEGPYNLAYISGHEVFYPCGNFQVWYTPVDEYLRIYSDFLRPRDEVLVETLRRYQLDTILVNKRNDLHGFTFATERESVLFENETFRVIDVASVLTLSGEPPLARQVTA